MIDDAAEQPAIEPEVTEEAAQTEDSAPQEEIGEETPAEPEEPKKAKGVQKRLDELTRNWREEQRRSQWLEQQVEKLQEQQNAPKQTVQGIDSRPKLEDFETTEDWAEALSDWKIEQKLEDREKQAQEIQQRQTFQEKERVFHRKAAEFSLQHEDFDDAIRSIPLSEST